MIDLMNRLFHDEAGATAIEYGVIVALIAAAILLTVGAVGGRIQTTFNAAIHELAV